MKTIPVLTDFTENAAHASKSAVMLASKLNTHLLLFNSYIKTPAMSHYIGGPWVVDEIIEREDLCKNKLKFLESKLKDIADKSTEIFKPKIHTHSGEGSVGRNVDEISQTNDIEMIVMGSRAGSTMDHILTGSETISVIDHATRPVLVVPANADLNKLSKVVFATDIMKRI